MSHLTVQNLPPEVQAALGSVHHLTQPAQGLTSTVVIAETDHGLQVVKRAVGTLYGGWLAREYRVLTALAPLPLPTPKPYAFVRRDTGVAPERWLVMDHLPGQSLAELLNVETDTAQQAALLRAFGAALAAIHNALTPADLSEPAPSWLDHMLDEAAENLEHFNVDGTPELLERLRRARPQPIRPALIHGDYTIDNMLVDRAQVTGIIDWSGGGIGDPRYDLALATRPQREAFGAYGDADLKAFYEGYGGQPLSGEICQYFIDLYEFF